MRYYCIALDIHYHINYMITQKISSTLFMYCKDKTIFIADIVDPYIELFKDQAYLSDHIDSFYNFKVGGKFTIIVQGFPSDYNYNEIRVI